MNYTEKQLEELGSKIEADEKGRVESLVSELKTAIQNDDTASMKQLTQDIKQVMMAIGQKIYSQADPTNSGGSDEPIETDFSVGK